MFEGPRSASIEELPEIVRLVNCIFNIDRYGASVDRICPLVFCEKNLENLRVIVCDGKIVSHLGIWEGWLYFYGLKLKIALIGSVCTHPDYRGRGYASMLVNDAFEKFRRDEIDLVMVSGARTLYSRFGCVEAGILYDYHISVNEAKLLAGCSAELKVEKYEIDRILDLIEVHQREPIRFRRSREEFKILADRVFTIGVTARGYASIFLSYRMSKPVSYMALLRLADDNSATVVEYAGSRNAILKTLYSVLKAFGGGQIKLQVPYGDWDLITLLGKHGLKPKQSYAPASFAIPNPIRFMEKIKPYVEERIGVEAGFKAVSHNGCIEIFASNESMNVKNPGALSAIVFGRPSIIRNLRDGVGAEIKVPETFKNVFPLPSISYGLNYI